MGSSRLDQCPPRTMQLHGLQDTSLFGANSDEPTGETQQTVMLDWHSPLVLQEFSTTAANESQSIDGGDACFDLNQNTKICNGLGEHWITNHSPAQPSPQAASDTPRDIYNEFISIDDEHNDGDTGTTSSPAESDANELDDWFGVPFDLVSDGAD